MRSLARLLLISAAGLLGAAVLMRAGTVPSALVVEIPLLAERTNPVHTGQPLFSAIHASSPNGVTSVALLVSGRPVAKRALSGAVSPNTVLRWQLDADGNFTVVAQEAEWEYAAHGGDAHPYPWGNDFDLARVAGLDDTAPVDTFLTNRRPFGAYNMAGNVRERVNDWYRPDYYAQGQGDNPRGPAQADQHVIRSSSFTDPPQDLRTTQRIDPGSVHRDVGFCCAR